MDTGSHILFGLTLAGLAYIDPAVAGSSTVALAVLIGAVAGSNAPDLDTIVRLKGEAAYVKHHRGLTHSLPALPIWALLIAWPLCLLFGIGDQLLTVVGWTFAAVCLHVALDLLNAYGVQCLRPFSKRWWHLDILCLFDPILFAAHCIALLLWWLDLFEPALIFTVLYGLTVLYIGWRAYRHRLVIRALRRQLRMPGKLSVIPDMLGRDWQFVLKGERLYTAGMMKDGEVTIQKDLHLPAVLEDNPIIRAAMQNESVKAFLTFAERVYVEWKEKPGGYEVIWSDVRFWHGNKMPFTAAVTMDRNLNVIADKVGWNKKTWERPHV